MFQYQAPNGTPVYWDMTGRQGMQNPTSLNASIQWDGSNVSPAYFGRYANGDSSPERAGSFIVSVGVEQLGGPAYEQVKQWLADQGETRDPTTQEVYDWAIAHYGDNPPPLSQDDTQANPVPGPR